MAATTSALSTPTPMKAATRATPSRMVAISVPRQGRTTDSSVPSVSRQPTWAASTSSGRASGACGLSRSGSSRPSRADRAWWRRRRRTAGERGAGVASRSGARRRRPPSSARRPAHRLQPRAPASQPARASAGDTGRPGASARHGCRTRPRPWSSTRRRSAPITLASGRQDQRAAAFHQPVQRLLDQRLVLGVDRDSASSRIRMGASRSNARRSPGAGAVRRTVAARVRRCGWRSRGQRHMKSSMLAALAAARSCSRLASGPRRRLSSMVPWKT